VPGIAHAHLAFLSGVFGFFYQVFPTLLGKGRNRKADDLAIVSRRDAEVGVDDNALDGAQHIAFPRLNHDCTGIRDLDIGYLTNKGWATIVVHE
jgi:hypothetical protein